MSVIELPEITAWEASPPELAACAGAPRNLPPATFTVGRVDYDEKEVGSTAAMMDVTRITLAAGTTPPAYTLSCGWPRGARTGGFLTAQQIYNAIGGQIFSMNVPR